MNRPNVLLIYTDQQRWDTIAALGNNLVSTPNLDRLCHDGTAFTHAFVNHPLCMPSRMSMLSGRYGGTFGITINGIEMPEDIPCLHNVLSPYGYHTASLGKLHFLNHSVRDHREVHPRYGFDTLVVSDEPGCYDDAYMAWVRAQDPDAVERCRVSSPPARQTDLVETHPREDPYIFEGPEELTHTAFVAERTCRFIERHHDDRWMCIAGIYAPHSPLNPPGRFVDRVDIEAMPPPAMHESDTPSRDWGEAGWKKMKAYYYALVSHVDDQVGRILKTLDDTGQRDNTLVVFTSDHGELLGDRGRTGKGPAFDGSSRVPLVMRLPGVIQPGQVQGGIVEAVDIVPTILELCAVQVPPTMQGRSLATCLGGGECPGRDSAFIEMKNPFGYAFKAVRMTDCLYVVDNNDNEQLYDLAEDSAQVVNRADDPTRRDMLNRARRELIRRWFDVQAQTPRRSAPY